MSNTHPTLDPEAGAEQLAADHHLSQLGFNQQDLDALHRVCAHANLNPVEFVRLWVLIGVIDAEIDAAWATHPTAPGRTTHD